MSACVWELRQKNVFNANNTIRDFRVNKVKVEAALTQIERCHHCSLIYTVNHLPLNRTHATTSTNGMAEQRECEKKFNLIYVFIIAHGVGVGGWRWRWWACDGFTCSNDGGDNLVCIAIRRIVSSTTTTACNKSQKQKRHLITSVVYGIGFTHKCHFG